MQSTAEEVVHRIKLIRQYLAEGKSPYLIKNILADKHEIEIGIRQIYLDIDGIRSGKYTDTWLDDLLDINYPEIFRMTLLNITEAATQIKELCALPDTPPRTKIMGLAKIADIEIARINALHRGPVIRELRKVRQRSRKLVEELAAERGITRKNDAEVEVIEGKTVVDIPDATDAPAEASSATAPQPEST